MKKCPKNAYYRQVIEHSSISKANKELTQQKDTLNSKIQHNKKKAKKKSDWKNQTKSIKNTKMAKNKKVSIEISENGSEGSQLSIQNSLSIENENYFTPIKDSDQISERNWNGLEPNAKINRILSHRRTLNNIIEYEVVLYGYPNTEYYSADELSNESFIFALNQYLMCQPKPDNLDIDIEIRKSEIALWFRSFGTKFPHLKLSKFNQYGVFKRVKESNSESGTSISKIEYAKVLYKNNYDEDFLMFANKADKEYAYQSDFIKTLTDKEKDLYFEKIKNGDIKTTSRPLKLAKAIYSLSLKSLSKAKRKIKQKCDDYDTAINKDNCFLFSLMSLTSVFNKKKDKTRFKNLPFRLQLKLKNERLLRYDNSSLKFKSQLKSTLKRVIAQCANKTLLVFNVELFGLHCETVCNHELLGDTQDHVKNMMNQLTEFKVYELIKN